MDVLAFPRSVGTNVASAKTENLVFNNIEKVRDNTNWGHGPDNQSSARLNGGEDSTRIGTAILLHVMAGDNFELAAHAYYNSGYANNGDEYVGAHEIATSLITALSGGGGPGGPGGPGGGEGPGGPGGTGGPNSPLLHALVMGSNMGEFDGIRQSLTDNTKPRAYINYMLFDEQMQLVQPQSGVVQVDGACADNWSVIETPQPISVGTNGYLLVYLNNYQVTDVFFDDLHVLHKKGRLLEENHYYPHGLAIRSGSNNPLPTREGYQGKGLQDEAGMELYNFHARQYDPQIGRFWGIDPADQFPSGYTGMGNNPANMIDPTGMLATGSQISTSGEPSRTDGTRRGADWDTQDESWTFGPNGAQSAKWEDDGPVIGNSQGYERAVRAENEQKLNQTKAKLTNQILGDSEDPEPPAPQVHEGGQISPRSFLFTPAAGDGQTAGVSGLTFTAWVMTDLGVPPVELNWKFEVMYFQFPSTTKDGRTITPDRAAEVAAEGWQDAAKGIALQLKFFTPRQAAGVGARTVQGWIRKAAEWYMSKEIGAEVKVSNYRTHKSTIVRPAIWW